MWLLLLLLLVAPPAFGQVDGCTYHHRGGGMLDGTPIFLQLWQQGCVDITFLQYVAGDAGTISFAQSPCRSYNMRLLVKADLPPSGAQYRSWFYQSAWGEWRKDSFGFVHD